MHKRYRVGLVATVLGCLLALGAHEKPRESVAAVESWSGTAETRAPIDKEAHGPLQTADFAMGCFWGADAEFGAIPGVVRTRCGYCGGTSPHPTYGHVGDHSETVEVDFDPSQVSYQKLVESFFSSPRCTASLTLQYRASAFYRNDDQKRIAEQVHGSMKHPKSGDVRAITQFTVAEDYHQKYYLRETPDLIRDFHGLCASDEDFMNSTAAARVNGLLGPSGHKMKVQPLLDSLGLSPAGQKALGQ